MKTDQPTPKTVDAYIAGFPPAIQAILQQIRATIRTAAPDAAETIKYQMPTYVLNGNLVSFGAYQHHIGLYPAPAGTEQFQQALSVYMSKKSTVRFPLHQPIPYALIGELVQFRVAENQAKASTKSKQQARRKR